MNGNITIQNLSRLPLCWDIGDSLQYRQITIKRMSAIHRMAPKILPTTTPLFQGLDLESLIELSLPPINKRLLGLYLLV